MPHWVRDFNRKIDKFVEKYRKENNRFPSIDEISEQFNITEIGVVEILKGRKAVHVVSLDKKMRNSEADNTPIIENIKSKEYRTFQLPIEDVIHLKNTMRTLKKMHKQVIYYLFYKDLTQINVAKKLGLTQRQVSRIKQEALNELRKNYLI